MLHIPNLRNSMGRDQHSKILFLARGGYSMRRSWRMTVAITMSGSIMRGWRKVHGETSRKRERLLKRWALPRVVCERCMSVLSHRYHQEVKNGIGGDISSCGWITLCLKRSRLKYAP